MMLFEHDANFTHNGTMDSVNYVYSGAIAVTLSFADAVNGGGTSLMFQHKCAVEGSTHQFCNI